MEYSIRNTVSNVVTMVPGGYWKYWRVYDVPLYDEPLYDEVYDEPPCCIPETNTN